MSSASERVAATPLPRGLLILLWLGSATLAVAGMRSASSLIAPTFLAIVLVITVAPVARRLDRWGAPGWLSGVATVLLVYAVLAAMVVAILACIGEMASLIPEYTPQINALIADVGAWLQSLGLDQAQIDVISGAFNPGQVVGVLVDLLSGAVGVLTSLAFIATVAIFIGFDAGAFPRHLLAARGERPGIVDALGSFARGTRTYMSVSAVFGLIVAAIDVAALALLGIPGVLAWGVLSFVTNFIPNIGFVIGVIPPAIFGLLEGGPGLMVAVIVVYSVINFVIQSLIQPKFQGDALGLTTTLTFLSLVFWAWVFGPLGAILALPLTLLAKAIFIDVDPASRWLRPLVSGVPNDEPAPAPGPDAVTVTDTDTDAGAGPHPEPETVVAGDSETTER